MVARLGLVALDSPFGWRFRFTNIVAAVRTSWRGQLISRSSRRHWRLDPRHIYLIILCQGSD